ncbi:unnamed protein product, partial [Scytosiphon promiscuus]
MEAGTNSPGSSQDGAAPDAKAETAKDGAQVDDGWVVSTSRRSKPKEATAGHRESLRDSHREPYRDRGDAPLRASKGSGTGEGRHDREGNGSSGGNVPWSRGASRQDGGGSKGDDGRAWGKDGSAMRERREEAVGTWPKSSGSRRERRDGGGGAGAGGGIGSGSGGWPRAGVRKRDEGDGEDGWPKSGEEDAGPRSTRDPQHTRTRSSSFADMVRGSNAGENVPSAVSPLRKSTSAKAPKAASTLEANTPAWGSGKTAGAPSFATVLLGGSGASVSASNKVPPPPALKAVDTKVGASAVSPATTVSASPVTASEAGAWSDAPAPATATTTVPKSAAPKPMAWTTGNTTSVLGLVGDVIVKRAHSRASKAKSYAQAIAASEGRAHALATAYQRHDGLLQGSWEDESTGTKHAAGGVSDATDSVASTASATAETTESSPVVGAAEGDARHEAEGEDGGASGKLEKAVPVLAFDAEARGDSSAAAAAAPPKSPPAEGPTPPGPPASTSSRPGEAGSTAATASASTVENGPSAAAAAVTESTSDHPFGKPRPAPTSDGRAWSDRDRGPERGSNAASTWTRSGQQQQALGGGGVAMGNHPSAAPGNELRGTRSRGHKPVVPPAPLKGHQHHHAMEAPEDGRGGVPLSLPRAPIALRTSTSTPLGRDGASDGGGDALSRAGLTHSDVGAVPSPRALRSPARHHRPRSSSAGSGSRHPGLPGGGGYYVAKRQRLGSGDTGRSQYPYRDDSNLFRSRSGGAGNELSLGDRRAERMEYEYNLMVSCLDRNVERFMQKLGRAMRPRRRAWSQVIARLRELVVGIWEEAKVEMYGSCFTGLELPSSDVDVVVCGINGMKYSYGSSRAGYSGMQTVANLQKLANVLQEQSWVRGMKVIETAAVPVIKILADPVSNGSKGHFMFDEGGGGRDMWLGGGSGLDYIPLDISFESPQHGGIASSNWVRDCIQGGKYGFALPAVMVLKEVLCQRGLNQPWSGGLSSYSLINMMITVLQRAEVERARARRIVACAHAAAHAAAARGVRQGPMPAPVTAVPLPGQVAVIPPQQPAALSGSATTQVVAAAVEQDPLEDEASKGGKQGAGALTEAGQQLPQPVEIEFDGTVAASTTAMGAGEGDGAKSIDGGGGSDSGNPGPDSLAEVSHAGGFPSAACTSPAKAGDGDEGDEVNVGDNAGEGQPRPEALAADGVVDDQDSRPPPPPNSPCPRKEEAPLSSDEQATPTVDGDGAPAIGAVNVDDQAAVPETAAVAPQLTLAHSTGSAGESLGAPRGPDPLAVPVVAGLSASPAVMFPHMEINLSQEEVERADLSGMTPGEVLVRFLAFFGRQFDPTRVGISVGRGALNNPFPLSPSVDPRTGLPLMDAHVVIEDPLDRDQNVARSCFGFPQV